MANQLGKDARLYLDDLDIYLRSFEMEQGIEAVTAEATKFGDDWEAHEIIGGRGRFTLNSYMDNTYSQGDPGSAVDNALDLAIWKVLTGDASPPVVKSTPAVMTFVPFKSPAIADVGAYFTRGWGQFSVAPARNGLVALRTQLLNTGPINRGTILAIGAANVTSAAAFVSSPGVQFTAAPTNFVRASLHVFTLVSAVVPTFTCTLESDDNSGFTSAVTRLTFTTFNTLFGEYKEVVLDNADDWYRVRITSDNATTAALGIIVVGHTS